MIVYENEELLVLDNVLCENLYLLIKSKNSYIKLDYSTIHNDTIDYEQLKELGITEETIYDLKLMEETKNDSNVHY